MQKYFCDVCGRELAPDYTRTARQPGSPSAICGASDLCPSCAFIEEQIDVKNLILREWKQLAEVKAKEKDAPTFAGRGRVEKQKIFARLNDYRSRNGAGCLKAVAEYSGLTVDGLRRMISGEPTALAVWKKANEALDKIEKAD